MNTTAEWLADAVRKLTQPHEVRFLHDPARAALLGRVKGTFLDVSNPTLWWEHLKPSTTTWATGKAFTHLPNLAADPLERCWLIAGLDDDDPQRVVVQCTPVDATAIIGECPAFEYALVDEDLTWIVIENHHDVLIAAGAAARRLDALRTDD
jgi:hypothetical protein